jgi:hypothetical protein
MCEISVNPLQEEAAPRWEQGMGSTNRNVAGLHDHFRPFKEDEFPDCMSALCRVTMY